jgi:intracellular septation protein
MKILLDFFPVLVFFALYKMFNIYVGTAGLMISSVLQMVLLKIRYGKIEFMYKLSFILIIIFGAVTLIFHNVMFLKWKITVLNWLLGIVFLGSQLFTKKSLIERMMAHQMQMPAKIWGRLNLMWGVYFLVVGAVNLYVMYHYSTADWVNFKLFGMLILTFIFVLIQTGYLILVMKKHKDQVNIGSNLDSETKEK